MYIDSHAHLTLLPEEDLEGVIQRAKEAKVEAIVNVCTTLDEWERGKTLTFHHPFIFQAASTTPHDVDKLGEKEWEGMVEAAESGTLVAIGETGLDYASPYSSKEKQHLFLHRYLGLAKKLNLPVILHCRDAFDDLFSILDEYTLKGVLHCFTGSFKDVEKATERGYYLSFSGIVTFKNAVLLREVANQVPVENLLIETDTPYLAPQSKRGKRNEPSFLPETAAVIAEAKGLSLETLASTTTANARRLFQMPK